MTLTNHRSGWSVTGKPVAMILPGVVPTDDQLLAFWHLRPGDARYADHARASIYPRSVLMRHNANFIIVPITKDITETIT